jgi:hypothetical protein
MSNYRCIKNGRAPFAFVASVNPKADKIDHYRAAEIKIGCIIFMTSLFL